MGDLTLPAAIVAMFAGMFAIALWGRRALHALGLPVHVFRYRNPHNRRCIHCNRHEIEHYIRHPSASFWEVYDEGKPGHRCSRVK